MEINAAAHKKQQESLSPEDKIQILNKNADIHKKKQESLSPNDKITLLRIILLTTQTLQVSLT
jgi:hypothetical protein